MASDTATWPTIDGQRKPAKTRCLPDKECGQARRQHVAQGPDWQRCWPLACSLGRGADGATWARSDGRRMPAKTSYARVKKCGHTKWCHVACSAQKWCGREFQTGESDFATWRNPTIEARPRYRAAPEINKAGKRECAEVVSSGPDCTECGQVAKINGIGIPAKSRCTEDK